MPKIYNPATYTQLKGFQVLLIDQRLLKVIPVGTQLENQMKFDQHSEGGIFAPYLSYLLSAIIERTHRSMLSLKIVSSDSLKF